MYTSAYITYQEYFRVRFHVYLTLRGIFGLPFSIPGTNIVAVFSKVSEQNKCLCKDMHSF